MVGEARDFDKEVRLKKPDGSYVWVPSKDVEAFYKKGYTFGDPNSTVFVDSWNGERESVQAKELPNKFNKGYTLGNAREEVNKAINKEIKVEDYVTPLETAGAFASSLDPTFGIVSGGINKAIDFASGKDYQDTNTKLRELKGAAPTASALGSIAGLVLPTVVTGGAAIEASLAAKAAATGLGASAKLAGAARIGTLAGLSGLEGVGYTLMQDAGEATLGNPNINAEKVIADAKTGFLWGALGSLAFSGAAAAISPVGRRLVTGGTRTQYDALPKVRLENAADPSPTGVNVFKVMDNETDEFVGLVNIDLKNPASMHPVGRTGVSLNDVSIEDAFKGRRYEDAAVGELIKTYGRVASNVDGSPISPELQKVFSSLGTKHVDNVGNEYFTAHRTPVEKITLADRLVEIYGKYRSKGIEDPDKKALFDRLMDKSNKDFRDGVLKFYNDPYKVITETADNVEAMAAMGKQVRAHSETLKKRMTKNLMPKNIANMQSKLVSVVEDAGSAQAKALENPYLYNKQVLAVHTDVINAVKGAMKETDPRVGVEIIRKTVKKLNSNIDRYKKATSGISSDDMDLLGKLSRDLNEGFLKDAKVTGRFGKAFSELQDAHAELTTQSKLFSKRYLNKEGQVSRQKITAQLTGKFDITSKEASMADAAYVQALNNYLGVARKLSKRARLTTSSLDDKAGALWTNVDSLKEIHDSARLINELVTSSNTGVVSGILEGGASASGAALSQAVGVNWFVGAIAGQHMGRKVSRTMQNPVYMIEKIESIGNSASNATSRIQQISQNFTNRVRAFELNKGDLSRIIPSVYKSHKYYSSMRDELDMKLNSFSPEALQEEYQELYENAPKHAEAVVKKSTEVADYLKKNIPPKPFEYKDVRKDTIKLQNLVEAAFDPLTSIEKFLQTGDRGALNHVEKLYPKLIEEVRLGLMQHAASKKLDMLQKSRLNSLFNEENDVIKKSLYDVQNLFKEQKEEAAPKQGGGGSKLKLKESDYQTNAQRISAR